VWQCSQCNETVEDDFEVCWNCCAVREGLPDGETTQESGSEDEPARTYGPAVPAEEMAFRPLRWLSRVLTLFCRLPCAAIAFLIQVPLWFLPAETAIISWDYSPGIIAFAVFGASLFVPRAIHQRDWKRLPALALFGAVAPFIVHWGMVSFLPPDSLSLHRAFWPLALITLVGTAEWLRSESDSWIALLVVTAMGVTAALAFGLASFILDTYSPLDNISRYLNSALLVTLTWISIPLGFWLAEKPRAYFRGFVGLSVTAAVGAYVWAFSVGVYWVASDSLSGGGWIHQEYSVRLLAHRGNEQDYKLLQRKLNEADWSQRFYYPPNEPLNGQDWRFSAVKALIRHDEPAAAENLSKILLSTPSRQLIDMTEGLFVRQKRYETVPIYLRYAEEESLRFSEFASASADRYKSALDDFNVPQVAHAWIRDGFYSQILAAILDARRQGTDFDLKDKDVVLPESLRKKMIDYLGQDAGPFCLDWLDFYNEVIFTRPSPLTNNQRNECQLVVECFDDYDAIFARFGNARRRAEENSWTIPVAPTRPNWDVPSAADLRREIDAYGERVDKAIQLSRPL
jgi:hypothetical protein